MSKIAKITEVDQFVPDSANNFLYNRFDIIYPGNYKYLRLEEENNISYIGIHLENDTAFLGVWCTSVPGCVFAELISFVFRKHPEIKKVSSKCCNFQN